MESSVIGLYYNVVCYEIEAGIYDKFANVTLTVIFGRPYIGRAYGTVCRLSVCRLSVVCRL